MLDNTHFVEQDGKVYRKRKAYMKWYYFDSNDYPMDWRLRASRSPIKKVKQIIVAEKEESPDSSPGSRNDSPVNTSNGFIIQ